MESFINMSGGLAKAVEQWTGENLLYVPSEGECWKWNGPSSYGMGMVVIDDKRWVVRRVLWMLLHERPPVGRLQHSLPSCGPECCNPSHWHDKTEGGAFKRRPLTFKRDMELAAMGIVAKDPSKKLPWD